VDEQALVVAVWAIVVVVNLRRSILVVLLLAAVAGVLAISAWRVNQQPVNPQPVDPVVVAPTPVDRQTARALEILHRWDAARSAAWSAGSVTALRDLYAPGSPAGAEDCARLSAYLRRGLVVDGMRMQVLDVAVQEATSTRLALVVTDRLAAATAVSRTDPSTRWAMPRDVATTRTLTLVRRAGRWVMADVTG